MRDPDLALGWSHCEGSKESVENGGIVAAEPKDSCFELVKVIQPTRDIFIDEIDVESFWGSGKMCQHSDSVSFVNLRPAMIG